MDRRTEPHGKACAVRAMRRVARVMGRRIGKEWDRGKGALNPDPLVMAETQSAR